MSTARKPWWQQATALVTVSAGGVITGFNFAPGAAALTTPASVPLHQLALEQAAQPDTAGKAAASDAQLRAAIVNVAGYYLKLAKTKTPAQIEALIWGEVSGDGADHGPSCAAFASLTLELAAQTTGLRSWVTGGTTYPWPLPAWADVRVDTNPASPQITSVAADAQAHGRWHPLGDGYLPRPGDWALYDGHVAVVTSYSGGVLDTIAADSLPGLTVNAHSSAAPLADQGIVGFTDSGNLQPASGDAPGQAVKAAPQPGGTAPANAKAAPANAEASPASAKAAPANAKAAPAKEKGATAAAPASAKTAPAKEKGAAAAAGEVPGLPGAAALAGTGGIPGAGPAAGNAGTAAPAKGAVPGVLATGQLLGEPAATTAPKPSPAPASAPANVKPAPSTPSRPAAAAPSASPSPSASSSPKQYATPATRDQQAFISLVAPGTVAAQQRYGVPASVAIAQAIEESAWGQSSLAARYHNLFGIKGTGPAGSVTLPTQEYENGSWVTIGAQFAVYHNDAESIADHAELLATSGYYTRAMADRAHPDAFANDLTGVYATDPGYGANLIALMKLYNLYQYDTTPTATAAPASAPAAAPARASAPARHAAATATRAASAVTTAYVTPVTPVPAASGRSTPSAAARYQAQLPQAVRTALFAAAKGPLGRGEHLYRDVAATTGSSWKLLAAADWMQCKADPRYSPVQGEKLGAVNADGTSYPTRTAALTQCAADLIELSFAVYGIDLTARRPLSVRELAAAFTAFRWGALLKRNGVSPMEFPYSVAGLTTAHQKMHWPPIDDPGAPDRPGSRFRQPFGAVPVVLSLGYPATV
jgi:flagellum-specific peptidoglycan hydrolase FlgJ